MATEFVSGKLFLKREPEMSQTKYSYEILLEETHDTRWAEWFEGSRLEETSQGTYLRGEIPDRPALHGILERIRDLNLSLVSVQVQEHSPKG